MNKPIIAMIAAATLAASMPIDIPGTIPMPGKDDSIESILPQFRVCSWELPEDAIRVGLYVYQTSKIYGDATGDGHIKQYDATLIRQKANELKKNPQNMKKAVDELYWYDVNKDNKIDDKDADAVLDYLLVKDVNGYGKIYTSWR